MPTVGVDRFEGCGARHIISHTMEMALSETTKSGILAGGAMPFYGLA